MGVLYYMEKRGSEDLFALNKVYRYLPDITEWDEWRPPPTVDELRQAASEGVMVENRDWVDRIHARIGRWACGASIRCASEFSVEDRENKRLTITGSAHDEDNDGDEYIAGSAW